MREFSWTLEYTVGLVRTLPLKKLNALIKEVQFQKELDEYRQASNCGMIISNWASAQGKKRYSVKDFIGETPTRGGKGETGLKKIAREEGIILPKEG